RGTPGRCRGGGRQGPRKRPERPPAPLRRRCRPSGQRAEIEVPIDQELCGNRPVLEDLERVSVANGPSRGPRLPAARGLGVTLVEFLQVPQPRCERHRLISCGKEVLKPGNETLCMETDHKMDGRLATRAEHHAPFVTTSLTAL